MNIIGLCEKAHTTLQEALRQEEKALRWRAGRQRHELLRQHLTRRADALLQTTERLVQGSTLIPADVTQDLLDGIERAASDMLHVMATGTRQYWAHDYEAVSAELLALFRMCAMAAGWLSPDEAMGQRCSPDDGQRSRMAAQ